MGQMFGGGNRNQFRTMSREEFQKSGGPFAGIPQAYNQYTRRQQGLKNQMRQFLGLGQPQAPAQPVQQPIQPQAPQYDNSMMSAYQGLSENNPYKAMLSQYFGGAQ